MNKEEAVKEGFATPASLSEWHTIVARDYSRQTVDIPSGRQEAIIIPLRLQED